MDEFDALAEELVDIFENRDELSANIGEALRAAAAKAARDERKAIKEIIANKQNGRREMLAALQARSQGH